MSRDIPRKNKRNLLGFFTLVNHHKKPPVPAENMRKLPSAHGILFSGCVLLFFYASFLWFFLPRFCNGNYQETKENELILAFFYFGQGKSCHKTAAIKLYFFTKTRYDVQKEMMGLKKWMYNALIALLAGVFVVSGVMLAAYWLESRQQAESYDALAALVEQAAPASNAPTDPTAPTSPWVTVTDPQTGADMQVLPEYAQLYIMNNDLVGWICLPGTKLSYPVMQTPDSPDYYLKRDFYEKSSSHGCIYAKEDCDVTGGSDNITLYGHYMKDGSMFAPLGKYRQQDYWAQNPSLEFNTLQQRHTYEIFAVFVTTASVGEGFRYHTFIQADTPQEFEDFVSQCKALSLYDTGITPQYGDKLITLSTCEYSRTNGRLVVVARRSPAQ